MKTVKGNKEAVKLLKEGKIVEFGDRYYKYEDGILAWSDYGTKNWQESIHSLDSFVKGAGKNVVWRVVE